MKEIPSNSAEIIYSIKKKQNLDYVFPTFAQFGTSVGSLTRTYKI